MISPTTKTMLMLGAAAGWEVLKHLWVEVLAPVCWIAGLTLLFLSCREATEAMRSECDCAPEPCTLPGWPEDGSYPKGWPPSGGGL